MGVSEAVQIKLSPGHRIWRLETWQKLTKDEGFLIGMQWDINKMDGWNMLEPSDTWNELELSGIQVFLVVFFPEIENCV